MHQEAKTLTSDTSPLRSSVDRPSARPCTGGRWNAGTGRPRSGEGRVFASFPSPRPNAAAKARKPARGNRNSHRRRPERRAEAPPAAALPIRGFTLLILPLTSALLLDEG